MFLTIKKSTTGLIIEVEIKDTTKLGTTDEGLTGLLFNSAGLKCYYTRQDAGDVGGTAVTLATMTRGTWASGGFIEKDSVNLTGRYQFGVPDAVIATGAAWATLKFFGAANMLPTEVLIQLVDNTAKDIKDQLPDYPIGTVVSDAGNTATTFKTDLAETVNDYWRAPTLLRFNTGSLSGQTRRLAASGSYDGTTKFITMEAAFTAAPAATDAFELLNR